jgi:hypothetical protein
MSEPTSKRPHLFRLQVSLRALLLLTLLVCVGLTIYRWPWVEETMLRYEFAYIPAAEADVLRSDFPNPSTHRTIRAQNLSRLMMNRLQTGRVVKGSELIEIQEFREQTTYVRGWKGSPVKHGLQRAWDADGTLRNEKRFVDCELVQNNIYSADHRDWESIQLRNGVRHGTYACCAGRRTWEGEFRDGKRAGNWKMTFRDGKETIVTRQAFVNDRAEGDWTWTNAAGQVLQTARFHKGRLVLWNGRPVSDELKQLMELQQVDELTRETLLAPRKLQPDVEMSQLVSDAYESDPFVRIWNLNKNQRLLLHSPGEEVYGGFLELLMDAHDPDRLLGEVIVQQALLASRTISFRFGLLYVVPICESELTWRDRTGVQQVQFEARTWQAASWEELRMRNVDFFLTTSKSRMPQDVLTEIFGQTNIEINTAELPTAASERVPQRVLTLKRCRRDVVGTFLSSHGWSCEQRGSKLIFHPYPAEDVVK